MAYRSHYIWLYCIYCERTFLSHSKNNCRFDGCEGELGDIWEWEAVRLINRGYPMTPVPGEAYALYGDGRFVNLRKEGYEEDATSHIPYNC